MSTEPRGDVTRLLRRLSTGEPADRDRLYALVYAELRRLAGSAFRRERSGHTLQPTALVHEAFLRLSTQRTAWESRGHFFAMAAEAMRRVLVDHARRRAALKRPGTVLPIPTGPGEPFTEPTVDLLALDVALDRLETRDARLARVVELRFFAGLNIDEIAEAIDVSERTVKRDWHLARAWLRRELVQGHVDA